MALLRRTPPPRSPAPPGDWMDALQAAMRVDPALRPKRDRPPIEFPVNDDRPRVPSEVPRRFRQPDPISPGSGSDAPAPDAPAPEAPAADATEPPAARVAAEKPWLVPIVSPAAIPPVGTAGPAPVAGLPPAAVEQLFQWVCRLSRVRRADYADGTFDANTLRGFAELLLTTITAAGPVGLRLRGPLASFVDVVMMRGGLPIQGSWRPLGPVPPERAYGLAVAESAADPTGLHDGSWVVHHAALSLVADLLPVTPDFPGGPAVLDALDVRLHGIAAPAAEDRICPAAYDGVFDHAIVRPVGRPIRALAAAAVGLLLLALAGAVMLNLKYVDQIRGSVDTVDKTLRAAK